MSYHAGEYETKKASISFQSVPMRDGRTRGVLTLEASGIDSGENKNEIY